MFEDFLTNVASFMGTTAINAGIVLSLFITIIIIIIVAIATKGRKFEMMGMIVSLFCTIMFTAMSWYPMWTGAVLSLSLSILTAWYFAKTIGGGS